MTEKKKDFLIAIGERGADTGSIDTLYKAILEDRAAKKVEQQEEIDELAHAARVAKLKKEANSADTTASGAGVKKDTDNPVKFEVKGGVDFGTLDLNAERKQAAEDLKQLKKEQEETIRSIGQQNEDLRDRIHAKEIEMVQLNVKSQLELLQKMIESNASKGDFATQLAAARTVAQELGYAPASAGGSGGGDLMAQIELKKLEFNNQLALRELDEKVKDRDAQRRMDILKLEDEREERKDKAAREAKNDEVFAKTTELIGRTIGAYLKDGAAGGIPEETKVVTPIAARPQNRQGGTLQAGVGESGTADCLVCSTTMAIGTTAIKAVCAKCGAEYPIERIQKTIPPSAKNVAAGSPEEEE